MDPVRWLQPVDLEDSLDADVTSIGLDPDGMSMAPGDEVRNESITPPDQDRKPISSTEHKGQVPKMHL